MKENKLKTANVVAQKKMVCWRVCGASRGEGKSLQWEGFVLCDRRLSTSVRV